MHYYIVNELEPVLELNSYYIRISILFTLFPSLLQPPIERTLGSIIIMIPYLLMIT